MTKSFDDIISNNISSSPEWQVSVNGKDYTSNLELLEFRHSINNSFKFDIKLNGVDSTDNIPENAEVVISYGGGELFRGVLKEFNPGAFNTYTFKGAGYGVELEGDSQQIVQDNSLNSAVNNGRFESTNIQEVVDILAESTNVSNSREFSTSYSGGVSGITVNYFRVKDKQLSDINRLMGEYDAEWYITTDGSNNPVLNVTDQLFFSADGNNASGNPKDVLKTYGADQSAKKVDQNINRNRGDFDGVLVRGYGDGDDQITAVAGTTGKDSRVLIYTDKTILSQANADRRAQNLEDTNTVAWQEIEVKPSNPNKIYGIGDELRVESENARLSDNYRVVEVYYKIHPEENSFESKLNLSNKPQTFVDDFKKQEEQTKSQTDYSQGARNTLNESNKDLAGSNTQGDQEVTVDFNIPKNITESLTGEDNTKQVLLDFVVSDYKKTFKGTSNTVSDAGETVVATNIGDFGDVDSVNTEANERDDNTGPTSADFVSTDVTKSGGAAKIVSSTEYDSGFTSPSNTIASVVDVNIPSSNTEVKANYYVSLRLEPGRSPSTGADIQSIAPQMGLNVDDGVTEETLFRHKAYGTAFSPDNSSQWIPVNYEWTWKVPDVKSASTEKIILDTGNSAVDGVIQVERVGEEGHSHILPQTNEGAENVQAYLLDSGGDAISGGINSTYSTGSASDSGKVNIDSLDAEDIILSKQGTNASTLTVKVNGTELSSSPYDLSQISSNPPYKKSDIAIPLNLLNTPGQNTVTMFTDETALVKGNVIVDHKVEGERQ